MQPSIWLVPGGHVFYLCFARAMKWQAMIWSEKSRQVLRLLKAVPARAVSGLLILCLVGIILLAANVWRQLAALEALSTDTTHWSLMQTEVEILRLQLAVERAAALEQTADLTELRTWFDVIYARVAMLGESAYYRAKLQSPKLAADAKILRSFLDRTVPMIDGPDSELRAGLRRLAETLPDIRQAARRLTLTTRTQSATAADLRRDAVAKTLMHTALLTVVLVLALILLSWMLLRLIQTGRAQMAASNLTSARLQTIFATSADAIIVTNRGGWIVDINPAAEVVFGHPREAALGFRAFDLLLPPDLASAQTREIGAVLQAAAARAGGADNDPLRIELLAMRSDGVRFPVELSLGSTRVASGDVIVALVRDISDRRRAQTALTVALKQAQAGERTKTDFIAVMSHEMRTPLNGLLGSLDLLAGTDLRGGQKDLVDVMAASGQILLHHVNSVLDISRADADRGPDTPVPFDLDRLIADCVANQAGLAATKGLTMQVVAPGGPAGWVTGDPGRLQQVLLNLIGNAVKFTAKGRITIEQERPGPFLPVEIRVIDTGIGIAETDIGRVFDDFVTLDARYARQAGGTGLGLGIARRVARSMGGEIGVESVPGDGSLFWLRLPLPVWQETVAPGAAQAARLPVSTCGMRVLVIEDNPVNRFVLRRLLEENGNVVSEAQDGASGVEAAMTRQFDLILTDISMPGMDGVEVTRHIRTTPGPSRCARVIAVTAHALPADLCRFHEAGIDDCLTKPITRVALNAVMSGRAHVTHPLQGGDPVSHGLSDVLLDPGQINHLCQRLGARATAALTLRLIAEGDAADRENLWAGGPDVAARLHALAGSAGTFGAVSLQAGLAALANARTGWNGVETARLMSLLPQVWHASRAALVNAIRVLEGETAPGRLPDATATGGAPGRAAVNAVPDAVSAIGLPDADTAGGMPGRAAIDAVPDAVSTAGLPDADMAGGVPGRAAIDAVPDAVSATGLPETASAGGVQSDHFTATDLP